MKGGTVDTEAQPLPIRPLLLSIPAACEALGGIGRTTLYAEIGAGRIKSVKIGNRAFISSVELERYVAAVSA